LLLAGRRPPLAATAALAAGFVLLVVFPTPAAELGEAGLVAAGTGLEVVAIILGGLWLDELLRRSGARERLSGWLAGVTADPGRRVLLAVLAVVPFVESVTGFGVGVIVGLPLLVEMGFSKRRAAVLSIMGFLAVPWGALAPGTLVAARLGGVGFDELGVRSAWLSLPLFTFFGVAALVVGVGWRGVAARLGTLAVAVGALWGGVLVTNLLVGTPLAGAAGSLAALGALILVARRTDGPPPPLDRDLASAARPYGLLLVLLLAGQLAAELLGDGLAATVVGSPALWLAVTCLTTTPGQRRAGLAAALPRWRPVALTTAAFLALGALMRASRMAGGLAGAGAALGPSYAGLAPWLGGFGGFLTGTNTGANALFAAAQAEAARRIGRPVLDLVGLQNVAASLATMASATRIQLALSLTGDEVEPAAILRPLLLADAAALAVLSVIGLLT
jgi:lactate permease